MIAAVLSMTATLAPTNQLFADDSNGMVVPMYGWDAGWDDVIDAKEENEGTEIIVVINPSSGPGGSKESHWVDVADDLQDAGIKVVGYSTTSYAGRSEGEVKDEIDRYWKALSDGGNFRIQVFNRDGQYMRSFGSVGKQFGQFARPKEIATDDIGNVADLPVIERFTPRPLTTETIEVSDAFLGKVVAGIDPNNGNLLWSHPHDTSGDMNITTPLWGPGDLLFLTSAYDGGSRMLRLTRDGAGNEQVQDIVVMGSALDRAGPRVAVTSPETRTGAGGASGHCSIRASGVAYA